MLQNASPGVRPPSSQQGVGQVGQQPIRRTLENTYHTGPDERFRSIIARQVIESVLERYLSGDDPRPALELVLGPGFDAVAAIESRAAQTSSRSHQSKHVPPTGSGKSQKMAEPVLNAKSPDHRQLSGIGRGGGGGGENTTKENKEAKEKSAKKEKKRDDSDEASKPAARGQSEGITADGPMAKSTPSSAHSVKAKASEEVRPQLSDAGEDMEKENMTQEQSPANTRPATSTRAQQRDRDAASSRHESESKSSRGPSPNEARDSSRKPTPRRNGSASRGASPLRDAGASSREASPVGAREPSANSHSRGALEAAPQTQQEQQRRPSGTQSKQSSIEAADRLSVPSVFRPVGPAGSPAAPVALDWTRLVPRLCVRLAEVIRREVGLVLPPRYGNWY